MYDSSPSSAMKTHTISYSTVHDAKVFPANHRDSSEFESGFVYGRDGLPLVVALGWRFGLLALGLWLGGGQAETCRVLVALFLPGEVSGAQTFRS